MAQKGFYNNMKRCVGCFGCQIACKDKFDLDAGENCRRVARIEGGKYPAIWVYNTSLACAHCNNPVCRDACPVVGALTKDKDTGLVLLSQSLCIGCRKCEPACPYGAITYVKATGKVQKCNGCKERLDVGKKPLCVDLCRMEALEFGDIDALKKAHPGWVNKIKGYADPAMTGPNVIFNPKPEAVTT